jgi:hypothetical protein
MKTRVGILIFMQRRVRGLRRVRQLIPRTDLGLDAKQTLATTIASSEQFDILVPNSSLEKGRNKNHDLVPGESFLNVLRMLHLINFYLFSEP